MRTTGLVSLVCFLAMSSASAQDAGLPVDVAPATNPEAPQADLGKIGVLLPPTWERVQVLGELLAELEDGLPGTWERRGFIAYLSNLQRRWLKKLELDCPTVAHIRQRRSLLLAAKATYERALSNEPATSEEPGNGEAAEATSGVTDALSGSEPAPTRDTSPASPASEELARRLARLTVVLDLAHRPVRSTRFLRELGKIGRREFEAVLDLTEATGSEHCHLGELERRLEKLER